MIDSVLRDPAAAEIVVVVDGSSDGSIELLEQLSRSQPRLRPFFMENRGLNAAVQAGVERATSEIVLILDDDLVASPGLASAHARHHRAAPNLVVLGYSPVLSPTGCPLPPPSMPKRTSAAAEPSSADRKRSFYICTAGTCPSGDPRAYARVCIRRTFMSATTQTGSLASAA